MNLAELIEKLEAAGLHDLAEQARQMAPPGRDLNTIDISARFRLEKFDGEIEPGKEPVEVVEGGDGLLTTITKKEM